MFVAEVGLSRNMLMIGLSFLGYLVKRLEITILSDLNKPTSRFIGVIGLQ